MVVNNMLKEVVSRSTQGADVRPRVDVSVIGYGPNQTVHNALGGVLASQAHRSWARDRVEMTDRSPRVVRRGPSQPVTG